ncbi:hypothetical protein RRF57_001465 [Xylaria bambusicola]|uniref:Uncharacterized protein n=1 Tax=Xylaria bambusicola TaxID=326684 RepID=A0AAN7UBJ6_9PEZI
MVSHDGINYISALPAGVGVPSILWRDCLLTVYGVPSLIGTIRCYLQSLRSSAPTSVHVLILMPASYRGIEACSQRPPFHMHIQGSKVDVSLRLHSETLWFIPPPNKPPSSKKELDAKLSPYYLEASSQELPPWCPGRGQGAFSSHGSPVLVPRAHILLEAFIRLASAFREGYGTYFLQMITYMAEYPFDDGFVNIDLLSKPCQTFWDRLEEGKLPVRQLMDELQRDLGDDIDR